MGMKIVQVCAVYPPVRGGMSEAPFRMVEELKQRGHEVQVFTPRVSGRGEMAGVASLRPWLRLGHGSLLPQLFWRLPACDILHLHYPCFGMSFFIWKWKKFTKRGRAAKLVLHYHMDPMLREGMKIFWWLEKKLVLPLLMASADRVVVASKDYAENSALAPYVRKLGEQLVEIPFMIDAKKFTPVERQQNDVPLIMFLSALDKAHYFKGLPVLLEALKEIPRTNLLVVGGGEELALFVRISEQLGIKDRVRFAGAVPEDKKIEYYQSADIFVLPSVSRAEAFGLVLLEAQACGVPVIASNLPGVRTVLKNGETGLLVRPGDAKDLKFQISDLLSDEARWKQMGLKARQWVEDRYGIESVMAKWKMLYRNCLIATKVDGSNSVNI